MNVSTVILFVTLILAAILVMVAVLLYRNYWKEPGLQTIPGFSFCILPGSLPQVPIPQYSRQSEKITPPIPAIASKVIANTIANTTTPNLRTRGLSSSIPTNKWYTPLLVGLESGWIAQYPYLINVEQSGIGVSWSRTTTTGPKGLDRVWNQKHKLSITTGVDKVQAADVLDWDTETCVLNYTVFNSSTGVSGSLRYPLIRGCPYISVNITNASLNISFTDPVVLTGPTPITNNSSNTWYKWKLKFSDGTAYFLYLSRLITPEMIHQQLGISSFTGWCRLAYVDHTVDQELLDQYVRSVPESTTLTSTSTGYTLSYSTSDLNTSTLMTTLDPVGREALLPYEYQVGPVVLDFGNIDVPDFMPVTNPNLVEVLKAETTILLSMTPTAVSDWCRWVGSLAMIAMIGEQAQVDTPEILKLLTDELLNPPGFLYLDSVAAETGYPAWGKDDLTSQASSSPNTSLVPNVGMASCSATDGVYTGTLHDYGYLMFAWDTLLKLQPPTKSTNPGPQDLFNHVMANLVREKDWWTGWDQTGGLGSQSQVTNPQNSLFSYWAAYRLSLTLNAPSDTTAWVLKAYLATKRFVDKWVYSANWNELQSSSVFSSVGYSLSVPGGDPTFPNRYASLVVPLTKPLSPTYSPPIQWRDNIIDFVPIDDTLTPESLMTSMFLHQSSITPDEVTQLPYGSLWTSAVYLLSL